MGFLSSDILALQNKGCGISELEHKSFLLLRMSKILISMPTVPVALKSTGLPRLSAPI